VCQAAVVVAADADAAARTASPGGRTDSDGVRRSENLLAKCRALPKPVLATNCGRVGSEVGSIALRWPPRRRQYLLLS